MKKMAPRLGGLGKGRRWLWDVIQIVHQLFKYNHHMKICLLLRFVYY